jgi:hypothetical protein
MFLDSRGASPPNEFYGSSSTAKLMHQATGDPSTEVDRITFEKTLFIK